MSELQFGYDKETDKRILSKDGITITWEGDLDSFALGDALFKILTPNMKAGYDLAKQEEWRKVANQRYKARKDSNKSWWIEGY
jgi:hypothetical protein